MDRSRPRTTRARRLLRAAIGAALLLVTAGLVAPSAHAARQNEAALAVMLLDPPTVSSTTWEYSRAFANPPYVSPPVTVTATGGVPPYSYAWQRIGGDSGTTAVNPTGSGTGWQRPIPPGRTGFHTSQWRCLVTDSLGIMAFTPTVTVIFSVENGD